ncbi:CPBP family intramembrane glutamic endopeptidase [Streptomonospora wellingtoniae]|uniref:CPBP family intramembrane glutamic endopeptidase n=1 Tax=Streptomonospora wellingtoniae TaxID=3075544 RepID=A0ABU2KYZ6_9ACTN|nr:CPBP family intramembrane glutamic endopeptidase [Streptomonospora sp. DSM 45055]MDT0304372.1 CPBP family intramembrane glutamic endopeptidase [Streptomonospora sp. DSM 45055]
MAKAFGRLLRWLAAAGVAALAAVSVAVWPTPLHGGAVGAATHGALLAPMVTGIAVAALLADGTQRRRLDKRVRASLEGHSMPYELTWLFLLLAVFLVATLGVSYFAEIFLPGVSWEVMMPPVRILFLFVLPLIVVDLGGFTITGYSTVMPSVAMRVTEGWRWMGLVPGAVVVALSVFATSRFVESPVPGPVVAAAAVLAIVAAVSVPEEIFFRALVQTRLECVVGRWPGILLSVALFTTVSVFLSEYGDFSSESELVDFNVGHAAVFYTVVGLLMSYIWASYRNIWLNILLRSAIVLLRVLPALQLM